MSFVTPACKDIYRPVLRASFAPHSYKCLDQLIYYPLT